MFDYSSITRRAFVQETVMAITALGLFPTTTSAEVSKNTDLALRAVLSDKELVALGIDPAALAKVALFIEEEVNSGSLPGALLVASRRGKVFFEGYWGSRCSQEIRTAELDSKTVHMVASFSKVITATVVAMAVQDGLLNYDESVSTYIPEFIGGGKEGITLRHLLTHSAGIPAVPLGPVVTSKQWDEAVKVVCAAKVEWEPGSKTSYHALSGMFVAAEAVRRVSDMKPWAELCQERLFESLGANSLTFGLPPASTPVSLSPQPKELPCPLDTAHFGLLGHPAGGCLGTPRDILKVLQLYLNGGSWDGKQLLQKETVSEMLRVQYLEEILNKVKRGEKSAYEYWGLGWLTRGTTTTGWFGFGDQVSMQSFGHAGLDTTIGIADPESDLALVFITTDSPKSAQETVRLRNTVTNMLAETLLT